MQDQQAKSGSNVKHVYLLGSGKKAKETQIYGSETNALTITKKYKYYQSFSVSHLNKLVHCTLLNVPAKIKILLSSSPSIVTFNINNMPNLLWIIPPLSISPFLNGFIKFPQFIFLFSNLSSNHRFDQG